ncbi:MAG: hypothetical protein ACJ74O_04075 [Frankiaceae bacterium]
MRMQRGRTRVGRRASTSIGAGARLTAPASSLVLPGRPGSVRLGRSAVVAWFDVAPDCYDVDTVLLLVTELLLNVVSYSDGWFQLSVAAHEGNVRIEVHDDLPSGSASGSAAVSRVDDQNRRLQLISALADSWGTDLSLGAAELQARVVWFESAPLAHVAAALP